MRLQEAKMQKLVGKIRPAGQPYARNPWAMHSTADGIVYIGEGNSSNLGPPGATNAGPCNIWKYSNEKGLEPLPTKIPEEQIERFREIDGSVRIPGHDPKGTNKIRTYTLAGGQFDIVDSPAFPHLYDVYQYKGETFYAFGLNLIKGNGKAQCVGKLIDGQLTTYQVPAGFGIGSDRAYHFFELNGELHVSCQRTGKLLGWVGLFNKPDIYRLRINSWESSPWAEELFESLPGAERLQTIRRSAVYSHTTFYIPALSCNDHQWTPIGFRQLSDGAVVDHLKGWQVWDVKTIDNTVYALASKPGIVSVQEYLGTARWAEAAHFENMGSFGRSFAKLPDGWLVGLGCEWDQGRYMGNPDYCGEIWRS